MGFKTVAIDNRPEGRKLATEVPSNLRPNFVVDSSDPNASNKISDLTAGEGLAGIVVCADSIPANTWSLQQLGNGGVMVPVGLPKARWQFDTEPLVFRELNIRGVYVASREQVEEMLKVVAEHNIVSHVTSIAFDEIPSLVEKYSNPTMKGRLVVQIKQ